MPKDSVDIFALVMNKNSYLLQKHLCALECIEMFFNNAIEKLLIRKRRNLGTLKTVNKDMHMCISKPLSIINNMCSIVIHIWGKKT